MSDLENPQNRPGAGDLNFIGDTREAGIGGEAGTGDRTQNVPATGDHTEPGLDDVDEGETNGHGWR